MKLLLDTHIWIWGLLTPHKLGRRVTRELASLHNEIWLSPVQVYGLTLVTADERLIALREIDVLSNRSR